VRSCERRAQNNAAKPCRVSADIRLHGDPVLACIRCGAETRSDDLADIDYVSVGGP
jgi:hypothetical protein